MPAEGRAAAKPRRWLWATFAGLWLIGAAAGLWVVWAWENGPGAGADAPGRWPAEIGLRHETDRPTIVMLAHPQCTCTRASLSELAEILARARTRPKSYVLFMKPRGFSESWEKTDLWRTAVGLPDATVVRDDDGAKAQRFGAETSGQTLLYDARGTLLFSGGITGARGHAGENAARAAVIALLNREGATQRREASVFGCPLFARSRLES